MHCYLVFKNGLNLKIIRINFMPIPNLIKNVMKIKTYPHWCSNCLLWALDGCSRSSSSRLRGESEKIEFNIFIYWGKAYVLLEDRITSYLVTLLGNFSITFPEELIHTQGGCAGMPSGVPH